MPDKAIKFFSSVKLAIFLLTVIIIASIIGTFIPQGIAPLEYIQRYGRQGYGLLSFLGLTDVYHSWWFILFLMLLAINLLVCSLNRIRMKKGRLSLIITHLSILIILSGGIVSAVFGQRGVMALYEGETGDSFTAAGNRQVGLGFGVRLDDFMLEWYDLDKHQIAVYVKDRDARKTVEVRQDGFYPIEGTDYSVRVLRYVPDFYLDEKKEAKTRSEVPDNPAFLVRILKGEQSEDRWIFSKFPAFSTARDANIELAYKWLGSIKDFKSRLTVVEGGKDVLTRTIEVNHPLKFKGYSFYQSNYNPEELRWTGLQVVKDPGVGLVYAGFILLNIGIVVIFYANPELKQKL